jgi:phosphatidylinositol N-acetylglucosaminyltransferase subunit P
MPPQSRGGPIPPKPPPLPAGFVSKSTPNLPTLRSLDAARDQAPNGTASASPATLHPGNADSPEIVTSPSEPASLEDFSLDSSIDQRVPLSPASSEDDGVSEEEEGHVSSLPPRPVYHHHHHSRSHTYLAPSAFAPPFYNRPPTPLPPSPSLTSLLRPTFSSANSRPTTPDPSSDEGASSAPHIRTSDATGTQTPNSAAASTLTSTFRTAKPIPRASPKVPTYEYYGFTLYLTSSLAFIVYLFWAFLPSPFLHQLGIYYFPDRWWALAVPAWTVMLIVYIYVALASYNTGYLTLPLNSVECLVDEAANIAIVDGQGKIVRNDRPSWQVDDNAGGGGGGGKKHGKKGGKGKHGGHSRHTSLTKVRTNQALDWRTLWNEGTDAVMDIPIGGVCEILYGLDDEDGTLVDGDMR